MTGFKWALLMLCLMGCSAIAATPAVKSKNIDTAAPVTSFQGDALAGKSKSEDERCQECHGSDGNGQGTATGSAGKFAKLAGQYPDYLLKQIRDFRSGERKQDLMSIMARTIDDTDAADIAAYFAGQKKMQGDGKNTNAVGKNLFINGDVSRNILPCVSCHGIDGKGIDTLKPAVPIIGGQDWAYLERQLQDWRSGERHNSAGGVMNTVTKQLSDTELTALTDYISSL